MRRMTSAVVAMVACAAVIVTVDVVEPVGAAAGPVPEIRQVVAGDSHSVLLKADGTVWAWGANDEGQLGNNSDVDSALPVQVSGLGGVSTIAAGAHHTLAVKFDGTVWAWGANDEGQLGDGTTLHRKTPVQVSGLTEVWGVAAGARHSLAYRSDRTARAWGYNGLGQLGDGTTVRRLTPVTVSGLTGVVQLAAGENFSLALRNDWTVRSWGLNSQGQLGNGSFSNRTTPGTVSGLSDVRAVAAGEAHGLAVRFDGTMQAWGAGGSGRLGDGTLFTRTTPVTVVGATDIVDIAAGSLHSLAVRSGGTVLAWGYNGFGQLGDGTESSRSTPVPVVALPPATLLGGGDLHTVAVADDGWVYAWGRNQRGQAGDAPTIADRLTPQRVFGVTGFTSVGAGETHSLARRFDGTVWAWGNNDDGELGTGNTADATSPVQVSGLSTAREVAAGGFHSMALTTARTVWAWGHNAFGQVGDGTTINRQTPRQVSGLTGAVAVSAGRFHSLALKADGTVAAWGYNGFGQLGDGDPATFVRVTPVAVSGLTDVVAIAAGDHHSLAVRTDGSVWAWGANDAGQLGTGTTQASAVPVPVLGPGTVSAPAISVAGGRKTSFAVLTDGSVLAWGANDAGQLGLGAAGGPVLSPAPVGAGSDTAPEDAWGALAGFFHAGVLRGGGTLGAWGFNAYGQLGDGTTTDRPAPQAVRGLTGLHRATAGAFHAVALDAEGSAWAWGLGTDGQLGNGTEVTLPVPFRVHSALAEDFVLATDPPTVVAAPGATATVEVEATSNAAWQGSSVSFTVAGAPSGSSATVAPSSAALASSSAAGATVSVSTSATQLDDYALQVTACGAGICHDVPVFVRLSEAREALGAHRSEVLADEPASYWRLDDPWGTTHAADEQDRNPGVVRWGVSRAVPGAVGDGSAMAFDGWSGHIDLGQPSSLKPDEFTVEAWVLPDPVFGWTRTIYRAGGEGMGLRLTPDNLLEGFIHTSLGVRLSVLGPPVRAGEWHHVAFTRDAGALVLYLDGVPVASAPAVPGTSYLSGEVAIGRDAGLANSYFDGVIDEVAVYPAALGAHRVVAHHLAADG